MAREEGRERSITQLMFVQLLRSHAFAVLFCFCVRRWHRVASCVVAVFALVQGEHGRGGRRGSPMCPVLLLGVHLSFFVWSDQGPNVL